MDAQSREFVRLRAGGICEYCRLPESCDPFQSFHLEHVIARQHGGDDGLENLCWSCSRCNYRKGTNLATIDSESGRLTPLFNPRTQKWVDHYALNGPVIVGLTETGRATVKLLDMNASHRVKLRRELIDAGTYRAT